MGNTTRFIALEESVTGSLRLCDAAAGKQVANASGIPKQDYLIGCRVVRSRVILAPSSHQS